MNMSDVKEQTREHDRLTNLRAELDAAIALAGLAGGTVTYAVTVVHNADGTGRETTQSARITINKAQALTLLTDERTDVNTEVAAIEDDFATI